MKTRDTDRGYSRMKRELFQKSTVLVGITEQAGVEPHPSGKRVVTLLEIAIWNEFGTKTIPERSFLRAWFDENGHRAEKWLKALMPSVIRGERTFEQVLEILGQKIVGEIQKRIAQGVPPPNAEVTIRKKGSDKPLVDRGILRSKITYVVRKS